MTLIPFLRPRSPRRAFGVGLIALALGATAVFGAGASADEITELRNGIPEGEEIREQIELLSRERDELLTDLNSAEFRLATTLDARSSFDNEQRRLAAQIEAAIASLRTVAVQAFMLGGEVGNLEFLVNVSDVSDLSWRNHLLRNHAGSSQVAIERLQSLQARASDEVNASIEAADRLRTEINLLNVDLDAIKPMIAEAQALQPLADAWDRAAIAIEEGGWGIAPIDKWEQLRFCESTHNYQAISPTGKFRGAYQFDLETWKTVGGTGDPVASSAAEQDARARELYARRGHSPWPECGFYLQ